MEHFFNYLKRNDLQQKDYQIQGITQMNDDKKRGKVYIGSMIMSGKCGHFYKLNVRVG